MFFACMIALLMLLQVSSASERDLKVNRSFDKDKRADGVLENLVNDNKVMKKTIDEMKQEIDVLKSKDYSQEKCQSGIFGFHRYPKQPAWPKTKDITFSSPFSSTPSVTHGITLLDVNKDINTRAVVEVTNVSKSGFTLRLKTFSGTKLYGFRVRWMACL